MTRPDRRSRGPFRPLDRPRVQVRHEGRWHPGRLHGWVEHAGGWWAVVSYPTDPGIEQYACVPAGAVRRAGPDD